MQKNSISPHTDSQSPPVPGYSCAGCGTLTAELGCARITSKHMPPIWSAFVCHRCHARSKMSPKYRKQIENAAAGGVPLSEVERLFANLGREVPTTALECDAALGLPPGSTAAFFGGA